MPDITMCCSMTCAVKEKCARHIIVQKPDQYRQSYFMNPPGNDENCEYFWPISRNTTSSQLTAMHLEAEDAIRDVNP